MNTRINVVIRVRPLLEHEIAQNDTTSLLSLDEQSSTIKYFNSSKYRVNPTKSHQGKEYHFDKVFGPKTTQEQLFKECNIPTLLDKVIEGYHATLFAYGQTGVGKTYTMEGHTTNKDLKNIIKVKFNVNMIE